MQQLKRATEYLLDSARRDQVGGYLQATQATALHALLTQQAQAGLAGSLAEIGVFKGKTLIGLALASRPDEPVVGVDPMMIGQHDLTPEFTANLERCLDKDERARLTLKRALSTDLSVGDWMGLLKQPARFVHLDGHHARETILHDLQLAASWLVKGGVVVIDDFLNELHPDLTSGIFAGLEAHPQLEPIAVIPRMGHIEEGGSKLVCTTRGDGAPYLAALDQALSDHLRPWSDRMLGREVRVYRSKPPQPAAKPPGVPIVFAIRDEDGGYWPHTAVAITSLAEHATIPISVHVLHDETLSDVARRRLTQIAQDLDFPLHLTAVRLPPAVDPSRLKQFGAASLYRLLIPNLFRDEPLVIYLDSDIVLNDIDIADLVKHVPVDAPLSAVLDPYIAVAPTHAGSLADLKLKPEKYFNSGVLALRPRLLPQNLVAQFMSWSDQNPAAIHPDQDFLNACFQDVAHHLPGQFNVQVGAFRQGWLKPLDRYRGKLLHYVGVLKPLSGALAPGALPFWTYAHRVPEIHAGRYKMMSYVVPVDGDVDGFTFLVLNSGDAPPSNPLFATKPPAKTDT